MNGLQFFFRASQHVTGSRRKAIRGGVAIATVGAILLSGAATNATAQPGFGLGQTAGQFAASGAALAGAPVAPSTPVVPTSASTTTLSDSQQLAAMNALIPMLTARATIEKLRADIAQSLADQARAGAPVSMPNLPAGLTAGAIVRPTTNDTATATPVPALHVKSGATGEYHVAVQSRTGNMHLVAVNSFDQKHLAIVDVAGRRIQVGEGDSVDGGWVVTAISDAAVTVARGRQTLTLRM